MGAITQLNQNDPGNAANAIPASSAQPRRTHLRRNALLGAYIALQLFIFIYWIRPTEWIPGWSNVPLAKITGILALLALLFSLRHIPQRLPREILLLAFLTGQLFLAAAMSPVWRGGAFQVTLDFAKILIIVLVMTLAVNSPKRLHRLIFIQAASVAVIAGVTLWKSHLLVGRLEGATAGVFSDPNDLALAIIISLPLGLALLFLSRNWLWKIFWSACILVMVYAVFLTGSRGGFLALVAAAIAGLWEFAIRGRRRYLLAVVMLAGAIFWQTSGGMIAGRLHGIVSSDDSFQQRQQLFWRSLEVTKEHPLFGVGAANFELISGNSHVTHNSYTQMSSEGGVPALILYVLILWCGFKNLRATKRLARERTESSVLARALFASLAGYAVGSMFLSMAYQFFPYILVAYTTALFLITRKSCAQSRKSKSARQAIGEEKLYMDTPEPEMFFHTL